MLSDVISRIFAERLFHSVGAATHVYIYIFSFDKKYYVCQMITGKKCHSLSLFA